MSTPDISRRDLLQRSSVAAAAFAGLALADGSAASQASSAPATAPAGPRPAPLHHILRIHLPGEGDAAERRATQVIDYCKRTGCSEVLLFTTSYDQAPSFQPLEAIEVYVTKITPQAQRLRDAGIVVSVNVLQTLGHVYFPMAMQKEFPFQRRVYADGHLSTEGACPLDEKLRAWVAGAYAIYARLKPPVMFVDDDYRTMMAGGMSCFCPKHLEQISAQAGRKVTRDEITAALFSGDYPAPALRGQYYEVTSRGFVDLAQEIADVVHRISPETRIGVMMANWPTGGQGVDPEKIARALAGLHRPMIRPQIPAYSEEFIRDLAPAFLNPSRLRAVLPDDIEYWPEIENYQYSLYAKSARCTLTQMSVSVLCGFNHLALNVFDMYDSPLGDSAGLIDKLQSSRGWLDRLHDLVPEGSRPDGVCAFEHVHQLRVRRANGTLGSLMDSGRVLKCLPAMGLPETFGRQTPWQVITGDDVLALDDAGLDQLLSRGGLLDATAAAALALRGQESRIGVKVGERIATDDLGYEQFSDKQISPSFHGRCFPLRPMVGGDWRRLEPVGKSSRTASEIRNYRREVVSPAMLLSENDRNERFAVLAFSGQGNRHLLENLMRPEQFRSALTWIARRPLPVCAHHDAPYVWPILNRTADGRRVIALVNLSTDTYEELPLVVDRTQMPSRLAAVTAQGDFAGATFTTAVMDDAVAMLTLDHRLQPLEIAVVVVEG